MTPLVLVRLTHVDHPNGGPGIAPGGEFFDIDLGQRHRSKVPETVDHSARSRSSGVFTLRTTSSPTGTSTTRSRRSARLIPRSPSSYSASERPARPRPATSPRGGGASSRPRPPRHRARRSPTPRSGRGRRRRPDRADRRRRRRRRDPYAADSAVSNPPSGPSPGQRSATQRRPVAARRPAPSPPTSITSSQPPAANAAATRSAMAHAVDRDQRLVPTHPSTVTAAEHRAQRRRARRRRGGHGSSCWTNTSMRSASSVSPMAAAIAPSPRRHRRKPRLVGRVERTKPEPRHPLARNASSPR